MVTSSASDEYTLEDLHGSLRSRDTGSWINQDSVKEVKKFDDFKTVDWVEDGLYDHRKRLAKIQAISHGASFKERVFSSTLNWMVLALMGLLIGLIAGCLNILTAWLASIRLGFCSKNFFLNKSFCCWDNEDSCTSWNRWSSFEFVNYVSYIVISVFLSYLAGTLVKVFAPFAAGSGISEIKCIVSGFVMQGFLGWKTLAVKSLALPLAIGSGLSVGKEGPSVHYAVCVGNSVAKLFNQYRSSASKAREFLTATSAAGVAVAFGSPIGGVLFSIEEISSVFQLSTLWKSYFCALVAVYTLSVLNPFRTGQLVLFEVTYDTNWHYFDVPMYIILGLFGGLYGIVVSKYNIRVVNFRKKYFTNFAIREIVILSVLSASICYFNEFLRLDMTESMQILFHECGSDFTHYICEANTSKAKLVASLAVATVIRMVLTIITYGCKVPAGIFVPSMAAGATFGRLLGIIMEILHSKYPDSSVFATCSQNESKCIIPGTYAFLGAAAALSGITNMTVSVVIIMFELTGALRYIVPTMIVVSTTKIINDLYVNSGIADQMIRFNGLPLIDSKETYTFNANVSTAMSRVIVAFPSSTTEAITLKQLKAVLFTTKYRGYPIIKSRKHHCLFGYVSRSDLKQILELHYDASEDCRCVFDVDNLAEANTICFGAIVNKSPYSVDVSTSLEYALEIFVKLGTRIMLIEKSGQLVGLLTRKDILRFEYTAHSLKEDGNGFEQQEQADAKVWNLMQYLNLSVRRGIGKLLHNNEDRYI